MDSCRGHQGRHVCPLGAWLWAAGREAEGVLPFPALSCPVLPCPALPCPVLPCSQLNPIPIPTYKVSNRQGRGGSVRPLPVTGLPGGPMHTSFVPFNHVRSPGMIMQRGQVVCFVFVYVFVPRCVCLCCLCLCVCVCVCLCVCVCVYVCVCMCVCLDVCLYVCLYVCICTCGCIFGCATCTHYIHCTLYVTPHNQLVVLHAHTTYTVHYMLHHTTSWLCYMHTLHTLHTICYTTQPVGCATCTHYIHCTLYVTPHTAHALTSNPRFVVIMPTYLYLPPPSLSPFSLLYPSLLPPASVLSSFASLTPPSSFLPTSADVCLSGAAEEGWARGQGQRRCAHTNRARKA